MCGTHRDVVCFALGGVYSRAALLRQTYGASIISFSLHTALYINVNVPLLNWEHQQLSMNSLFCPSPLAAVLCSRPDGS